jgi:hypothetical protein
MRLPSMTAKAVSDERDVVLPMPSGRSYGTQPAASADSLAWAKVEPCAERS